MMRPHGDSDGSKRLNNRLFRSSVIIRPYVCGSGTNALKRSSRVSSVLQANLGQETGDCLALYKHVNTMFYVAVSYIANSKVYRETVRFVREICL